MTENELMKKVRERWESIVMHRAIEAFGNNNQIDQAEQELIELLDALKHRHRPGRETNLYEEIADVEIMLEQLKIIFRCDDAVSGMRTRKLARLEQRIDKYMSQGQEEGA